MVSLAFIKTACWRLLLYYNYKDKINTFTHQSHSIFEFELEFEFDRSWSRKFT